MQKEVLTEVDSLKKDVIDGRTKINEECERLNGIREES